MQDKPTTGETVGAFTAVIVVTLILLWFFPGWAEAYKNYLLPTNHVFFWIVVLVLLSIGGFFILLNLISFLVNTVWEFFVRLLE